MEKQRTRGRPRQFAGERLSIRVPAIVAIRLNATAQQTGKTISQIVRESLENYEATDPKN
jgi:predicted DNA-binding protein